MILSGAIALHPVFSPLWLCLCFMCLLQFLLHSIFSFVQVNEQEMLQARGARMELATHA